MEKSTIKAIAGRLGVTPLATKLYLLNYYHPRNPINIMRYILFDRELSNFTYDLSDSNIEELVDFISKVLNIQWGIVRGYVAELLNDSQLRASLEQKLRQRKDRNGKTRYGRRIGWYCIARIIKPVLTIETGTCDGLGSALLARALYKNQLEGHPGLLRTFDIDRNAGWLLDKEMGRDYALIIGDTKITLGKYLSVTDRPVDLFIHDSDHSYTHETFELETVSNYLAEGAVVISDNAHGGNAMKDFCDKRRLGFSLFMEKPIKHFYPGAGIGLSVYRR